MQFNIVACKVLQQWQIASVHYCPIIATSTHDRSSSTALWVDCSPPSRDYWPRSTKTWSSKIRSWWETPPSSITLTMLPLETLVTLTSPVYLITDFELLCYTYMNGYLPNWGRDVCRVGERKIYDVSGPAFVVCKWEALPIHYQVARPVGQQLHFRPAGIVSTAGAG